MIVINSILYICLFTTFLIASLILFTMVLGLSVAMFPFLAFVAIFGAFVQIVKEALEFAGRNYQISKWRKSDE